MIEIINESDNTIVNDEFIFTIKADWESALTGIQAALGSKYKIADSTPDKSITIVNTDTNISIEFEVRYSVTGHGYILMNLEVVDATLRKAMITSWGYGSTGVSGAKPKTLAPKLKDMFNLLKTLGIGVKETATENITESAKFYSNGVVTEHDVENISQNALDNINETFYTTYEIVKGQYSKGVVEMTITDGNKEYTHSIELSQEDEENIYKNKYKLGLTLASKFINDIKKDTQKNIVEASIEREVSTDNAGKDAFLDKDNDVVLTYDFYEVGIETHTNSTGHYDTFFGNYLPDEPSIEYIDLIDFKYTPDLEDVAFYLFEDCMTYDEATSAENEDNLFIVSNYLDKYKKQVLEHFEDEALETALEDALSERY